MRACPISWLNIQHLVPFYMLTCDIYSSAHTIFTLLDLQIQPGTVIVFDEYLNFPNWQEHEHKAFMEWVARHQAMYEYIGYTFQKTATHRSGHQLAVRITGVGEGGSERRNGANEDGGM